jgi:hypothetical protein
MINPVTNPIRDTIPTYANASHSMFRNSFISDRNFAYDFPIGRSTEAGFAL